MTEREDQIRKRVVVGVDGSDRSKEALRWATRIATALDADIDAVIAWDFPRTYGAPGYVEEWRPDLDAGTALRDTIGEVFGANPPPDLRLVVCQGPAPQVLLQASTDAEMLVVGSRGLGGFAGMLLGSVSAACAEHSHCSVLVVHAEPSTAQTGRANPTPSRWPVLIDRNARPRLGAASPRR